ncbi:MAG: hydrolase [Chloroherpetonaceae bacterium]|nr:hydrolase [Chloroherpetonaceae bacterium]MDW8436764.1 hydrolase [Chloroherpetonaceae bacterium]
MLELDDTVLLIIDVQGKLATLMHERETLFKNLSRLIEGAQVLGVPILLTEQYPKGLGETAPELKALMPDVKPIEKLSFSCFGEEKFVEAFESLGREQVLVAGIEAHICVYQTVADLLEEGFDVHCVADAISSRAKENREIGLARMKDEGATITSTEMCLFELMRVASGPTFKTISALVK